MRNDLRRKLNKVSKSRIGYKKLSKEMVPEFYPLPDPKGVSGIKVVPQRLLTWKPGS